MKSYIRHISLLLLACLGMTSCTEQDLGEIDNNTQGIEFSVNCVNLGATRAEGDAITTKPGETDYNENLISSLHYFLYESGKTDQPAVLTGHFEDINAQGSYTLRIPLEEGMLNTVFPRPIEKCEVYLIANLPKTGNSFDIPENTSLANLKTMVINSTFQQQVNPGQGNEFTEQSSFVMDGQGVATIENRKATIAAKGSVQLDRLASKFSVRISVEEYYTDTDGTYYPDVKGMQVHLVKASQNTTLAAPIGSADCDYVARKAIKDANGDLKTTTVTKVVKETNADGQVVENQVQRDMYVFDPFYSYPREWEYKADDALVLHVMLPWKKEGEDKWKQCHYKVFPSVLRLDRNNWYNVDLHIGVLGSFENEEATWPDIEGTYRVQSWNNGTTDWGIGLEMGTEILGGRYLVVEQTEYVVNNKNEFEIPFISSHTCTIEGWTVSHAERVTENKKQVLKEVQISNPSSDWLDIIMEGDKKYIKLNHPLNNNFLSTTDKTYDCTAYTFTINLRHSDSQYSALFHETITIIQKPAISITSVLNSYRDKNSDGIEDSDAGTDGYQFVNGTRANSSGNGPYGGACGLNGHNTDPYMYIVEVSVLPKDSEYILGDPRSETVATDLDFTNFVKAPGIETGRDNINNPNGTIRTLNYYYGTKKDATVENMIAPKFRVASSHGGIRTNTVTHQDAFNRAATYQEDGYPAGRWRVPTKAEILFLIKLFNDQKIPQLFSTGITYWSANGSVTPSNNNGNPTVGYDLSGDDNTVRCVYDDWYWEHSKYFRMPELSGDYAKYGRFTWGDEVK